MLLCCDYLAFTHTLELELTDIFERIHLAKSTFEDFFFKLIYNELRLTTILFQLPCHPPSSKKNRLQLVLRDGGGLRPRCAPCLLHYVIAFVAAHVVAGDRSTETGEFNKHLSGTRSSR